MRTRRRSFPLAVAKLGVLFGLLFASAFFSKSPPPPSPPPPPRDEVSVHETKLDQEACPRPMHMNIDPATGALTCSEEPIKPDVRAMIILHP